MPFPPAFCAGRREPRVLEVFMMSPTSIISERDYEEKLDGTKKKPGQQAGHIARETKQHFIIVVVVNRSGGREPLCDE
jgi:hypothetical protein